MKKTFILFLIAVFSVLIGKSQVNEFEVGILSPTSNEILDTNAKVNISAVVINRGPNIINSTDQILFDIKIGSKDSTVFIDTALFVGRLMQIDDAINYNLVDSFAFYGTNRYEICVGVKGTISYPTNSSKDPAPCVGVLVNQIEIPNRISSLYYANGNIKVILERPIINGNIQVLSMTGKELLNTRTNGNKEQFISFNPTAKGIYFVRIIGQDGESVINKFIVH